MYLQSKEKKIKIRNIVRIIFIVIGLIFLVIINLRFSGYDKRAMIEDTVMHLCQIYLFSVSMILAEIRDLDSYRNKMEKYVVRAFIIPTSLFFLFYATRGLYFNAKDILIKGYFEDVVYVSKVTETYRGFSRAYIRKYNSEYYIQAGYVRLTSGTRYRVHIFPNSKIVIGRSTE